MTKIVYFTMITIHQLFIFGLAELILGLIKVEPFGPLMIDNHDIIVQNFIHVSGLCNVIWLIFFTIYTNEKWRLGDESLVAFGFLSLVTGLSMAIVIFMVQLGSFSFWVELLGVLANWYGASMLM